MNTPNGTGSVALMAALMTACACGGTSQPDQDAALKQMIAQEWGSYGESIGFPDA